MWTSRQRVEAAFAHTEPDRTPIFEYVLLSPIADFILGRKYAGDPANWPFILKEMGWQKSIKQIAIDMVDLAVKLEHDLIYTNFTPLATEDIRDEHQFTFANDPVEVVRARNAVRQTKPYVLDKFFDLPFAIAEELKSRNLDILLFAPAYEHGIWTDTDLMQTMVLEPETAQEHFEICTKTALFKIEQYKKMGAYCIGIGGDFAGNTLMISPAAYREFIVPGLQILSNKIHADGLRSINTSDGNLWPVIDDFLLGSSADGYMEIDMHAGMDLATLKSRYGKYITFMGNLDCGNILSFGSESEISQHVKACLKAGMGNGGHIFCSSNAITSSIPLKNYLAVLKAYRRFFGLPELQI